MLGPLRSDRSSGVARVPQVAAEGSGDLIGDPYGELPIAGGDLVCDCPRAGAAYEADEVVDIGADLLGMVANGAA